jgi:hypothetical protein
MSFQPPGQRAQQAARAGQQASVAAQQHRRRPARKARRSPSLPTRPAERSDASAGYGGRIGAIAFPAPTRATARLGKVGSLQSSNQQLHTQSSSLLNCLLHLEQQLDGLTIQTTNFGRRLPSASLATSPTISQDFTMNVRRAPHRLMPKVRVPPSMCRVLTMSFALLTAAEVQRSRLRDHHSLAAANTGPPKLTTRRR